MRQFVRGLTVIAVIVVLSTSASAAPRGERDRGPREKVPPIGKILKTIIRALGDGLTVPLP
jgi:hypothetical protein